MTHAPSPRSQLRTPQWLCLAICLAVAAWSYPRAEAREEPTSEVAAIEEASPASNAPQAPLEQEPPPEQASIVVPGTQVEMPTPAGFVLSERFSGFEDTYSGASILVVELPAEAFAELRRDMTTEALAERGIVVRERREEIVDGLPAIWIDGTQPSEKLIHEKRLLVVGGEVTVLLTATIPSSYASEVRLLKIEAAMRALRFRDTRGESLTRLPFVFSQLAGFRFTRTLAGRAAVLVEEKPFVTSSRPAVFMVSVPLLASCAEYDGLEDQFGREVLGNLTNVSLGDVLSSRRLELGGRPAIEHIADGISAVGEPVMLVQTLVFDGCGYLRSVGMAPNREQDAYLARFRALTRGVRLK